MIFSSWWFQPIWKILLSQIGNLPQVGVNIKVFETTNQYCCWKTNKTNSTTNKTKRKPTHTHTNFTWCSFPWTYATSVHRPVSATHVSPSSPKNLQNIWATKKKTSYFPLNPGCLTGILVSWYEIIPGYKLGRFSSLTLKNPRGPMFSLPSLSTSVLANGVGGSS